VRGSLIPERFTAESAGDSGDDGTHLLKHAENTMAANPKTLDFLPLSEFSVDGMDPAPVIQTASTMGQDGNLDHPHRTTEGGSKDEG
jgi:hypothetical protein